jgi:hypothetical protein
LILCEVVVADVVVVALYVVVSPYATDDEATSFVVQVTVRVVLAALVEVMLEMVGAVVSGVVTNVTLDDVEIFPDASIARTR